MKKLIAALRLCLLACAMPFMAAAEEGEGRINGTVKDPDGAVVSGASVSLLNAYRAVIGATTTDADGRFALEKVEPGDYQLSIESTGFVRHRSAVRVTPGDALQLAIVLEVTPVAEQVTITAEAGLVSDTRKVDTQVNVINERKILERAPEVVAQVVDEETGVNLQRTRRQFSAVVLSARPRAAMLFPPAFPSCVSNRNTATASI